MADILKIDRIISVSYTNDPSCLAVLLVLEGESAECIHYLRDNDEYGNSPYLRQWIEDNNPEILPYVPPEPEPEPIPDIISRRQFYQQLALQEVITKQEALAAISNGAVPQAVTSVIDQIEDDDEKFNAQMLLIGAQTFERLHPLSDTVKQIAGWTDEQRDQFWLDASKI